VRLSRVANAFACLLAGTALLAGCGESNSDTASQEEVASRPAPPASEFPSASGRSLAEVLDSADGPSELVVSPAAQVFYQGRNRYSFGVFEVDRTQVPDAEVALYFAKVPPSERSTLPPAAKAGQGGGSGGGIVGSGGGQESSPPPKAIAEALDQPAMGPFTARVDPIQPEPAFRAQTTTSDPDAAIAVYVTELEFPSNGEWRIAALIKEGEKITATLLPSAVVGQYHAVPEVGERPPRIHTPTPADVGGDRSQLTTRIPPETMNDADFYDVLGERPIVLLFATPAFCQSRVCGPVVDVAEQVGEEYGDEVEFIHMEIFNDNDPAKGIRPQVRAFNLPSEPWLFVIDRNGVIRTAIEGAFGVEELEQAVQGVTS
jgi:hypothetical protein